MMATAYSHGSGNWFCGLGFCSGGSPPDGGQPGRLGSAQHESAWWFVGSSGDGPGGHEARHHRERTENDELSFYIGGHNHIAPEGPRLGGCSSGTPREAQTHRQGVVPVQHSWHFVFPGWSSLQFVCRVCGFRVQACPGWRL